MSHLSKVSELCSKYDRERGFDVILRSVVPCLKLRWIFRKHSNVARQVEIPGKSTSFAARQVYLIARNSFHAMSELTLPHNCKHLGPVHTMPVWLENGTTDLVPSWFFYGLTSVHTMPDRVPFSCRTVFRSFSCRHRVNRRPFRNDFVPFSNLNGIVWT